MSEVTFNRTNEDCSVMPVGDIADHCSMECEGVGGGGGGYSYTKAPSLIIADLVFYAPYTISFKPILHYAFSLLCVG